MLTDEPRWRILRCEEAPGDPSAACAAFNTTHGAAYPLAACLAGAGGMGSVLAGEPVTMAATVVGKVVAVSTGRALITDR